MPYAILNAPAVGNNIIVAGTAGNRIEVTALFFQCSVDATAILRSGLIAAGDLTGALAFVAGGGLNIPFTPGLTNFRTNIGEDLVLNLAGALATAGGGLMYEVVPA